VKHRPNDLSVGNASGLKAYASRARLPTSIHQRESAKIYVSIIGRPISPSANVFVRKNLAGDAATTAGKLYRAAILLRCDEDGVPVPPAAT
jgi:hypothetical protein